MQDLYQAPVLILTVLLLPAFGHLFYRTRDIRNLLWFIAFTLVIVRSILLYSTGNSSFLSENTPWSAAIGEAFALTAAVLFLSSLSPLSFQLGRFRVLYAIPFAVPLVVYALLACWIYRGALPQGVMFWVFPVLGFCSILVGIAWGRAKGSLPVWVGLLICGVFGALAISVYFRDGLFLPLILAESGVYLLAAMLVVSVSRRFSPGVVVSFTGFVLWSLPVLLLSPRFQDPATHTLVLRLIVGAKVATALGLILLALEDELAANQAARERERRIRGELEAYAALEISPRGLEDFDRHADHICEAIASQSCFTRVALILLHSTGIYRVAGTAGLDGAAADSLATLAARIPADFLRAGTAAAAAENSRAVLFDLSPWARPGDRLERMEFTSVIAIPFEGRTAVEGALLLGGRLGADLLDPLRHDDLGPVEMLAARLQAVRTQGRMMEKLIHSEKFAGLGQLAGNVTQQLHNPLTVILGYGSLLEESPALGLQERKGVGAILNAARSMRATLESLQRVARTQTGHLSAISLTELLRDMEQLHQAEFVQRAIDFRLEIADHLPRVLGQPQQLRQAILHCLQFSMEMASGARNGHERAVTVDAGVNGANVRITITHSGPGFAQPERAFDPLIPERAAAGDTVGLGLSLSATIMRENNGDATAVNLDPSGAAIILELEAASLTAELT